MSVRSGPEAMGVVLRLPVCTALSSMSSLKAFGDVLKGNFAITVSPSLDQPAHYSVSLCEEQLFKYGGNMKKNVLTSVISTFDATTPTDT